MPFSDIFKIKTPELLKQIAGEFLFLPEKPKLMEQPTEILDIPSKTVTRTSTLAILEQPTLVEEVVDVVARGVESGLWNIPTAIWSNVRAVFEPREKEFEKEFTKVLESKGLTEGYQQSPFSKISENIDNWMIKNIANPVTDISLKMINALNERQQAIVAPLLDEKPGLSNWKEYVFTITGGVVSLAEVMGLWYLTKSSNVAAGFVTYIEALPIYNDARDAGKTPDESLRIVATSGLGTFLLEKLGIEFLFGNAISNVFVRGVAVSLFELGQEELQTMWQNLVRKVGFDKVQKITEGLWETAVAIVIPAFFAGLGVGLTKGPIMGINNQVIEHSFTDIAQMAENEGATDIATKIKNIKVRDALTIDQLEILIKNSLTPAEQIQAAPWIENRISQLKAMADAPDEYEGFIEEIQQKTNSTRKQAVEAFNEMGAIVTRTWNDINEQAKKTKFGMTIEDVSEEEPLKEIPEGVDPLAEEAKKFKSVEEFVEAQSKKDFQDKVTAGQVLGEEIGRKVNPDGTITLFHGTSKQNAAEILSSGFFEKGTFFSVKQTGTEFGDSPMDLAKRKFGKDAEVIRIKVDARGLESAAAGSEVFSPKRLFDQPGGFYAVEDIKTKQQLIDIYNQATKEVEPTITKEVKPPTKPTEAIPEALQPLAQEARKFKSAEEFVKAQNPINVSVKDILPTEGHTAENTIKLRKPGKDVLTEPIRVEINKQGKLQIQDGNHRFFNAIEKGNKTVPVVFNNQAPLLNFEGEFDRIEDFFNQATKEAKPTEPIPPKLPPGFPKPPVVDIPPLRPELNSLENQYEKQKDIWFKGKDRRLFQAKVEKRNLQKAIKTALGKKKYDAEAQKFDKAIQLFIDTKRNPTDVEKFFSDLTPEQQELVKLSQNLPTKIKAIADRIAKSYEKLGIEALEEDVIRNVLDNYAGRVWDIPKDSTNIFKKFGTTTRHAKQRKLATILEGWSKGLTLKVEGATNNLEILKIEIVKTIEDKKFIKTLQKVKTIEGESLLSTKQLDDYKRVEHPNFKVWLHAGKAEPGKSYGRNFFLAEDGNLFERKELYAPEKQANNLNNILGVSKLKDVPGIKTITKYNAIIKAWILQSSFFHHLAFIRSYYLGTNHKQFSEMNVVKAYKLGIQAIEQEHPLILQGVENGLTLGLKQDWSEELLQEKTLIGKILDKNKVTKVVKDKILAMRQAQADFLFGEFGAGLKAKAFLIEYRNQIKKHPTENTDDIAKRVANLINDDFGGLHLQRLGRNPTLQHIFRVFALAPDWTESNVRSMVKAVKSGGKTETAMYRNFWAGILTKGILLTVLANLLLNGDEFDEIYKRAWKEGGLKWLDIDITNIYKALGGKTTNRKYFSILGHFKDPLKFITHPIRSAQHKGSVVYRFFHEALTGVNWAGRKFTEVKELLKTGKTVAFGTSSPLNYKQLPSFILSQLKGFQPVQIQNLLSWIAGEMEGFDAIANSLGIGVKTTFEKEKKPSKGKSIIGFPKISFPKINFPKIQF